MITDNEEKFAHEVISLLKDENRREEIGRKAVENIRKNYSWEANLKAFDNLLQTDTPWYGHSSLLAKGTITDAKM